MIINLMAGMMTGFVAAMPPLGPIAFAIIAKGFQNEAREGRGIAVGAAFMDFLYSFIAFSGIALIVSFFPSGVAAFYRRNLAAILTGLTFAGGGIVLISGLKIIRTKIAYAQMATEECPKLDSALAMADKLEEKTEQVAKHLKIPVTRKANNIRLFFFGVLLCLSITLPAIWIGIIGFLKGLRFLNPSFPGGVVFSLGVFAGSFTWYGTLLKLITGNRKRVQPATVNTLNVTAGIILMILGALLLARAAASL